MGLLTVSLVFTNQQHILNKVPLSSYTRKTRSCTDELMEML